MALQHDATVGAAGQTYAAIFRIGGVAQDLTLAGAVEIVAESPGGVAKTWTDGVAVTDATAGEVTKTWDEDDLDEPSVEDGPGNDTHWLCQMVASIGTAPAVYSDHFWLRVGRRLGTGSGASITLTPARASRIESAIEALAAVATADSPATLTLRRGTYTLEAQVYPSAADYVTVEVERGAVFNASYSPATDQADVPTNALFRIEGTAGALDTTLTTLASKGATSVVVTSAAGLAAGGWLLLSGNNDTLDQPNQSLNDSDGANVTMYTLAQISDDYVSGTTVTLASPLDRHHVAGARVQSYTPVIGFQMIGEGLLDCSGGSVAVGVLLRGTVDCAVRGGLAPMRFDGFSRFCVQADHGSVRPELELIHCEGESNGVVGIYSCTDWHWRGITRNPRGARVHANGLPRHDITIRERVSGGKGEVAFLSGGSAGILCGGGDSYSIRGVKIANCDPTTMMARWALEDVGDREYDSGYLGVALQGTVTPLGFVEFVHGITIVDLDVDAASCVVPTTGSRASLVDITNFRGTGSNWKIINRGAVAAAPAGIRFNDASGVYSDVEVFGCSRSIWLHGGQSLAALSFSGVRLSANAGSGVATSAIYLDSGEDPGGNVAVTMDDVTIVGYQTNFTPGSHFNWHFEMRGVYIDGLLSRRIGRLFVAENSTGTAFLNGEPVVLTTSAAGERQIVLPAAGARADGAVVKGNSDVGTGMLMVQDLNDACVVLAGTAAVLEPGTAMEVAEETFDLVSHRVFVHAAAGTVVARADTHKAVGAPAYVYSRGA